MADQLRMCPECGKWVHVSKMHVGWRGCYDCESAKRKLLQDLGVFTPDMAYAESERKIWEYARAHGKKIDRLID